MADILPFDADSAALAARLAAPEQRLLAGLVEHDASGWIPDAHGDDCDDDGCTGCDPQYLAEQDKQGLLAEQIRDMKYVNADSPVVPGFEDCPCAMCPPAGVTIPRLGGGS